MHAIFQMVQNVAKTFEHCHVHAHIHTDIFSFTYTNQKRDTQSESTEQSHERILWKLEIITNSMTSFGIEGKKHVYGTLMISMTIDLESTTQRPSRECFQQSLGKNIVSPLEKENEDVFAHGIAWFRLILKSDSCPASSTARRTSKRERSAISSSALPNSLGLS